MKSSFDIDYYLNDHGLTLYGVTVDGHVSYWVAAPPNSCHLDIQKMIEEAEAFTFEEEEFDFLESKDVKPISKEGAKDMTVGVQNDDGSWINKPFAEVLKTISKPEVIACSEWP